jgi:hypothetical protein
MNSTLGVLRAIGSPFVPSDGWSFSASETRQLLDCATDNKIGLLFLETAKRNTFLGDLEPIYREERERYLQTLVTAQRVACFLEQAGVEYALYKTLKPFPITPNDVDVLLFGDRGEQEAAIGALSEAGFAVVGVAPLQTCMYDGRDGGHGNSNKQGGIYYVDLYREASASHVIYLNKQLLRATVQNVETRVGSQRVHTLRPEADLLATLAHSVFPEQLYTLNDYYSTLYYLTQMDTQASVDFVTMVEENSVSYAVRSSLGITAALHHATHNLVPLNLRETLAALGGSTREVSRFTRGSSETPHRFSVYAMLVFLLERAKDARGRASIVRQLMNMWKPQFARYILQVAIDRRRRQTY